MLQIPLLVSYTVSVGSIGSLIAFYLKKSQFYKVILLQRSPEAIVSSLTLEREDQKETATDFESEVVGEPGEVIKLLICSVKVQTTLAVLKRLKPRLTRDSCIVFLQVSSPMLLVLLLNIYPRMAWG